MLSLKRRLVSVVPSSAARVDWISPCSRPEAYLALATLMIRQTGA